MTDLSLVSMEDLITEMMKRTNNIVIVGEKLLDKDKSEMIKIAHGDPIKCLGLIEVVKPSLMPDKLNTNFEE